MWLLPVNQNTVSISRDYCWPSRIQYLCQVTATDQSEHSIIYVSCIYHWPIRTHYLYHVTTPDQEEHSICITWLLPTTQNTISVSRNYHWPIRMQYIYHVVMWLLLANQNTVSVSRDYWHFLTYGTQYLSHVTTTGRSEHSGATL